MLKRTVNYTDLNGMPQSEEVYFNLTKAELLEMEMSTDEGFAETLRRIIDAKSNRALLSEFKKLILSSYGKKSEDGRRFIKDENDRKEFEQSLAFDQLFTEFATDANAAAVFVNGIIPTDLVEEMQKMNDAAKSLVLPPPPPPAA